MSLPAWQVRPQQQQQQQQQEEEEEALFQEALAALQERLLGLPQSLPLQALQVAHLALAWQGLNLCCVCIIGGLGVIGGL